MKNYLSTLSEKMREILDRAMWLNAERSAREPRISQNPRRLSKKKRRRLPGPADEERALELIEAAAQLRAYDENHIKNLAELLAVAADDEAKIHNYERPASMLVKKGVFKHIKRGGLSGYYLTSRSPTHVSEMLGDARRDPCVG